MARSHTKSEYILVPPRSPMKVHWVQGSHKRCLGSLKALEIQLIRWPPPTLVWCCRSSCPPHMRTMVLVYLPTKLGDFVRANVGKYSIHGAYVLKLNSSCVWSKIGVFMAQNEIRQKSPNPIEIMGHQLEISIYLGCEVAKKLENSTTATSMELSTKGMVLKLQIWYSHCGEIDDS